MKNSEEFKLAVALLLPKAPSTWFQLQVVYRYSDDAMDLKTAIRKSPNDGFSFFDLGSFELMDFFDEYRKRSRKEAEGAWTKITVTVNQDHSFDTEYGYETPRILS